MTASESIAKPIDPAALAAATVAVAIGSLLEPGPFGLMDMLVGAALLLIVLGYDDPAGRAPRQSCAIAAVVGLAAVVALGFPGELIAKVLRLNPVDEHGSRLSEPVLFVIWFLSALITYGTDRRRANAQ